jgi:hypothetical protein
MKTHEVVEVQVHTFLTLALDGDEWSPSRPSLYTPGEEALSTYWVGGCEDRRAVLDTVTKRKNPFPVPSGNGTPIVEPVT